MCRDGRWMLTPTHGTTYSRTDNVAPPRDNVANKEVHEVTGGEGLPAVLSYSGPVNMNEEINVPLLEENALGHVLRRKGTHVTCSLLYAQISVDLLL